MALMFWVSVSVPIQALSSSVSLILGMGQLHRAQGVRHSQVALESFLACWSDPCLYQWTVGLGRGLRVGGWGAGLKIQEPPAGTQKTPGSICRTLSCQSSQHRCQPRSF